MIKSNLRAMRNPSIILVIILFWASIGCKKPDTVHFPEGLQAYAVTDSLPFNPEWMKAEKKLVVASKSLFVFSIPFMDIVSEYDLPVIIYISGENAEEIIETLKGHNFIYPFIHDPQNLFFEDNRLNERFGFDTTNTVVGVLLKKDEIYKPAQIGMREILRDQLVSFMGE